jgi:hypothetical protein
VFERIGRLVEEIDGAPTPDAVAELLGVLDRLTAKATLAVQALDANGGWAIDGDVSLTTWLRRTAGLSTKEAGGLARRARRLGQLPGTAQAYDSGVLTSSQLAAVVANVTDRTAGLFAEHEAELLPTLTPLDPAGVAVAMRVWASHAEALLEDTEPAILRRELYLSPTLDGRRVVSGSFDLEAGEILATAIQLASTRDTDGEPERSPAERRADALVDIARRYLTLHDQPGRNRNRPRIDVLIDLADLEGRGQARLLDGMPLDRTTTRRLLCDAELHRVLTDGSGVILDYGRATRLVPRGLWDALVLRDRHCRHPGCDRPPDWSEAHHVHPWEHGGETNLANLVLKCTRHHHLAHQPGWHEKLTPDGVLHITTPTGRQLQSRPPP